MLRRISNERHVTSRPSLDGPPKIGQVFDCRQPGYMLRTCCSLLNSFTRVVKRRTLHLVDCTALGDVASPTNEPKSSHNVPVLT
jgi:hypothetical protein